MAEKDEIGIFVENLHKQGLFFYWAKCIEVDCLQPEYYLDSSKMSTDRIDLTNGAGTDKNLLPPEAVIHTVKYDDERIAMKEEGNQTFHIVVQPIKDRVPFAPDGGDSFIDVSQWLGHQVSRIWGKQLHEPEASQYLALSRPSGWSCKIIQGFGSLFCETMDPAQCNSVQRIPRWGALSAFSWKSKLTTALN